RAALHKGLELAEPPDAKLLQDTLVLVEGVAGKIEADRLEFFRELLHGGPGLRRAQDELRRLAGCAEKIGGALGFVGGPALCGREDGIGVRGDESAVRVEGVKRSAFGERFDRALVQRLGVDATGKVAEGSVKAAGISLGHDRLDGARADVLEGCQ